MSLDFKIPKIWHQKGVGYLEDCYEIGSLMSFEDLRRKYELSSLTVRSFLSDLERLLHEGNAHQKCTLS